MIKLEINEHILWASLEDNSSVVEFMELLKEGPLTLEMKDYANMEKIAQLDKELVQNNICMNTKPGDIILYQGKTLAIYYDTNTWNLTPIGKIVDINKEELKEILGKADICVRISLSER